MPKRIYSGGRIRITEYQAALIQHLLKGIAKDAASVGQWNVRCEVRDLELKVSPYAVRFTSQGGKLWATPAPPPTPGVEDVAHNYRKEGR